MNTKFSSCFNTSFPIEPPLQVINFGNTGYLFSEIIVIDFDLEFFFFIFMKRKNPINTKKSTKIIVHRSP